MHGFKIQNGQQLHDGKAAADVPDAQVTDGAERIAADVQRAVFQIRLQEQTLLVDGIVQDPPIPVSSLGLRLRKVKAKGGGRAVFPFFSFSLPLTWDPFKRYDKRE